MIVMVDLGGEMVGDQPSWLGFRFGRDEIDIEFGGDTGERACDYCRRWLRGRTTQCLERWTFENTMDGCRRWGEKSEERAQRIEFKKIIFFLFFIFENSQNDVVLTFFQRLLVRGPDKRAFLDQLRSLRAQSRSIKVRYRNSFLPISSEV